MNGADLFLDQWLIARGDSLRGLVEMALSMIDHVEVHYSLRQRRRRAGDLRTHKALVETLVCNLALAVLTRPHCSTIVVPLTKRNRQTRYDRPIFRKLRETLDMLEAYGFLKLNVSSERGKASTIRPDDWFVGKVAEAGIGFADFGHAKEEEVIILTRSKWDFGTNLSTGEKSFGKQREWIDYRRDTGESRLYRSQVRKLNSFLSDANLELVGDASGLDISQRRLRRYFSLPPDASPQRPRFDLGGRLFGGWWQNLGKSERHRIRIDGELVADLDFAGMFPRLAYLKAGKTPPRGDLYAVKGLEAPQFRDGVKGMLNTLLFATGPKHRVPSDIKAKLPPGWTAPKVKAAILATHSELETVIEKGAGLELMFTESQILIAVLLRLREWGIVALPMHDGMMVASSRAEAAAMVMEDVANEIAGAALPVVAQMP